ncbi:MAG: hypothetical protein A2Y62_03280 [Candidatus Fischerbacteria bacterium RBG_13_37_8]|uniref:DUF5050 domain-containing protein n=1 Tax=Candidatus Fischerbacteria bacterium RBG_13_37_8 TaxID=1817863 RepID=A0A1F5VV45_9BACT|nr:MAG: hypothetical protein A2Y62_03280 [Candidatus Fischerbacteria bacterium RBG_13_37_8]
MLMTIPMLNKSKPKRIKPRSSRRVHIIAAAIAICCVVCQCGKDNPVTPQPPQPPSQAQPVNITSDSSHDDQNPAFSPDGQFILFSSKRNGSSGNLNLWVMTVTGAGASAVTNSSDSDNVNMPGSSWSKSGNRICFSSDRNGNDEIWTVMPDGTGFKRITFDDAPDWEPTFSPDGNWIVFQSNRDNNWDIYKININTGNTIRLTNNAADDWEPNWSPVGNRIVFQSNRTGNWDIFVMNADGTGQQNITGNPAEDTDPSWSPDGSKIVYSSNYGGLAEADIFVVTSDGGGTPIQITNNPAYDGAPSFSPDGKSIAFESNRSGNLDIWIVEISTSFSNGVSIEKAPVRKKTKPGLKDDRRKLKKKWRHLKDRETSYSTPTSLFNYFHSSF